MSVAPNNPGRAEWLDRYDLWRLEPTVRLRQSPWEGGMGGMSWVVEERPGMGLPVLHFAPGTLPSGGPRLPLAHSARSLATLLPT